MPVIRGTDSQEERPPSPRRVYTVERTTSEYTYSAASYGTLDPPTPGEDQDPELGSDYICEQVETQKAAGGSGLMTVSYATLPRPTVEIEWQPLEKAVELNPCFMFGQMGGLDRGLVKLAHDWVEAADPQERANIAAKIDAEGLADLIWKLVDKLSQGVESYVLFTPVINLSTFSREQPATAEADIIVPAATIKSIIESAIGGGFTFTMPTHNSADYEWRKDAHRIIYHGGYWEIIQSWRGADKWDSDLYPPPN